MIAVAFCLVATAPARADTIRVIIPFAPGGALDPIARILTHGWNRLRPADSIIVENIAGAGGIVGMNTVAKAIPDGRTLLFSPSGNIVISPMLQSNLPYDTPTAFEPLVLVGSVKSALIVCASLDVTSLGGLIALAKTGAPLTFGSPGPGTSPHISGELLNHAAGISITWPMPKSSFALPVGSVAASSGPNASKPESARKTGTRTSAIMSPRPSDSVSSL